jgi:hypothetical protein
LRAAADRARATAVAAEADNEFARLVRLSGSVESATRVLELRHAAEVEIEQQSAAIERDDDE